MSVLNEIFDRDLWKSFYGHKISKNNMRDTELQLLERFIEEKRYEPIVRSLSDGGSLSLPTKRLINKMKNSKKRVVYTYAEDENYVLKLITHLLYRYDDAFSSNLYSFRKHFGVKKAFSKLASRDGMERMCSYKVDIHDYFNSVDVELCISELSEVITDDASLLDFIKRLLREDRVVFDGETVSESHGIMAGVPLSSFLANVYLRKMDKYFEDRGVIYARYSDDIIVFAETEETLGQYVSAIHAFLSEYKLEINPEKEVYTTVGEAWTFLGFRYINGEIDIAPVSVEKVKAKLRRKARALLRWKRKKGIANIHAVRAFIKYINRFFYRNAKNEEMTWTRWYFPVITVDTSLKLIDGYCLELIRFIMAEKHSKAMYNLRYPEIKQLGYRPLVPEFYSRLDCQ